MRNNPQTAIPYDKRDSIEYINLIFRRCNTLTIITKHSIQRTKSKKVNQKQNQSIIAPYIPFKHYSMVNLSTKLPAI